MTLRTEPNWCVALVGAGRATQSFRLIGYDRPAPPNPLRSLLSVSLHCLKGISLLASCTCWGHNPLHSPPTHHSTSSSFSSSSSSSFALTYQRHYCRHWCLLFCSVGVLLLLLLLLAALPASGSQGGHLEKQGGSHNWIQTWRCNCDTGATVAQDVEQVATYDCGVNE